MTRQLSDQKLVTMALEGDTEAFADLVHRYADSAYNTARFRVTDRTSAFDAVQDAFVTAFERLSLLREKERFGAWLRKLVIAECARLIREQQRALRSTAQMSVLEGDAVNPSDLTEAVSDENEETLGRAAMTLIRSLPPNQREAAELCLVRGVARNAAAAFLGVEESTLRKRLHDAKRKLQAQVFQLARDTMSEDQLPPGFTKRCVCRCERSRRKQL